MLLFGSPADLLNGKLELRSLFGQKDVEQKNCRLQDRLTIGIGWIPHDQGQGKEQPEQQQHQQQQQ